MVHLLRKYQQTLMLFVTVLVIISFVWFYNYNKDPYANTAVVGTLYGRRVTAVEFKRGMRLFEVARNLMLFDLLQSLVGQAQSLEQARENFVWNSLIMRHAADQLAITATDDEVIADVQKLSAFQTNGVYDSNKYNLFIDRVLAPNGMTALQLEELVRDHLRLQKLKTLIGSSIAPTPPEVRDAYERLHRKTELSVVRFKFDDFKNAVKLTEEDLKKAFEEQKATLKSDELRKVKFVAFVLPPAEKDKKRDPKESAQEMQKLADKAEQFIVAMTEKDAKFDEVAKKLGVEVKETAPFSMHEPPEELGKSEDAAQTVFERLTMEQPNSDPIVTPNGYYVLQLTGITPSRPLTYDEAKPKLENQLKEERAQESMTLKAAEVRQKIDAELKAGKSFADAATAAGMTAEKIPAFSFAEPPPGITPEIRMIMSQSAELGEHETSAPVPIQDGVALVHVDKREPVDETKFAAEKNMLAENISRSKRDSVFEQWLKTERDTAGVNVGQS